MKKINWKEILVVFLSVLIICILKNPYIQLEEDNTLPLSQLWMNWTDNQYVNLIWLLPLLLSFYYSSKTICMQLEQFEMRFKNRKNYILYLIKKGLIYIIIINIIILFLQALIILLMQGAIIEKIPWLFIIHYLIKMLLFATLIVILYFFVKNYIYSYLIFVIFLILLFMLGFNNYFILENNYILIKIILSIICVTINIFLIYKIYIRYNIGGAKYEVRN